MSPPILVSLLMSSNPGTLFIESVWGIVYSIISTVIIAGIGIIVFIIHSICEVIMYFWSFTERTHFLTSR